MFGFNEISVFKWLFWYLFIMAILYCIMDVYLISDHVYYDSYIAQYSEQQIASLLAFKSRYRFLVIFLFLVIELLKFFCVSCILWIGVYLYNKELTFRALFKLVVAANYIFLIVFLIKLIWLLFYPNVSVDEIQSFYPLSLLSVVGYTNVDRIWIYPLQIFNLFELGYLLLLARGISFYLRVDYDFSFRIVISSYLPALLIWLILSMYLFAVLTP